MSSETDVKAIIEQKDSIIESLEQEIQAKEKKILQLVDQLDQLKSLQFHSKNETFEEFHQNFSGKKFGFDLPGAASLPPTGDGKVRRTPLRSTKRQAVSAESAEFHSMTAADRRKIMTKIGKAAATKDVLNRAIQENEFLRSLDAFQVREMVERMQPVEFPKGSLIIREGDQGSLVFAIEEGSVEISRQGAVLAIMGPGKIFGEVAILYNCKRTASAKALDTCKLWTIERKVFQAIMMAVALMKREEYTNFLLSVPIINNLPKSTILKIVDALEEVKFEHGEYIIRQDQPGDTFYIISKGSVKVTKNRENPGEAPLFICMLHKGQFFGEVALETEEKRSANIVAWSEEGVTCLVLERKAYKQLIGKSGYLRPATLDTENPSNEKRQVTEELEDINLSDLQVGPTIGVGGFGKVELVTLEHNDKILKLALKKMAKKHVVETCQQEHVMNEKDILKELQSNFIIRLYKTFKDSKYLYLLMELGEGGELWMLLRSKMFFDSNATRFYSGCVIEALEYLHKRAIIFRDIKPENLVLNEHGYVKLVDFGFAKKLSAGQRTFTFCGTPEYLSPEVILNKGHDHATDIWALGVFIYELQTGSPPFNEVDHMKTYRSILKGIESVEFPKSFNKFSQQLVKLLCRENPNDRLGYSSQGMKAIRKHAWFDGFNWDGLRSMSIKAPHAAKSFSETDFTVHDDHEFDATDDESGWDADF